MMRWSVDPFLKIKYKRPGDADKQKFDKST